MEWLEKAALIIKVLICNKAGINKKVQSLKVYKELYHPKLFFLFSGNKMTNNEKSRLTFYLAGQMHRLIN